eukprot:g9251.t1
MSTDEFQDFTYASHWEKLAGEIEQVLRKWLWTREGTLSKEQCRVELKQKLHFRKEPYILSLQLPHEGQLMELENPTVTESGQDGSSQDIPGSSMSSCSSDGDKEEFEFLPEEKQQQISGVLSNHSNPSFSTELFLKPSDQFDDTLHNIQRWFGVSRFALLKSGSQSGRILDAQEASTVLSAAAVALSEFSRSIPVFIPIQDSYRDAYKGIAVAHGHSIFFDVDSSHMTQVPDHLRSVLGQLQVFSRQLTGYSTRGARLCEDIACGVETQVEDYEIGVSSCVIYSLPDPAMDAEEVEEVEDLGGGWDDGCVWQPWAAQKDPVASLELDLIWEDVELSTEDPTPTLSAMNANLWKLHALQIRRSEFASWSIFAKKSSFERKHLQFPFDEVENSRSCFSRLVTLLQGVQLATQAHSIGDLDSEEWWEEIGSRTPSIPPESLFEDSIHDLFGDDFSGAKAFGMTEHVTYKEPVVTGGGNGTKMMNKVPVFDTLTSRFALHCVVYRNARAVALLWGHFVQAIRLHFWEKLQLIPVMFANHNVVDEDEEPEAPDLNTCLIHQKLQMLNVCIHRLTKKRVTRQPTEPMLNQFDQDESTPPVARGVAGALSGAFLQDCPEVPVNIPMTQPLPVHTSDSLAEEASVLSALHESPEDRERASREQAKVLISDMAAFKAANPQGQLSDFVKWHSPKDWVRHENGEGCLSQRMSHEKDNKWQTLWTEVEPCPAIEQLPLFDP